MTDQMDWKRLARVLDRLAAEKQDEANSAAVTGKKAIAVARDETASLLRLLASAIKEASG